MSTYRIHVSRDNLMFAAGHFATYDDGQVEPLHGHNYRLGVTLEGPLDQNAYVFNFVTLKRLMKRLADELDHRMLLARHSRLIAIEETDDGGVIVRAAGRWYRFPREDVVLLDTPNTTVEVIAQLLCARLRAELAARPDAAHLTGIEVTLEESFGQAAIYREEMNTSA